MEPRGTQVESRRNQGSPGEHLGSPGEPREHKRAQGAPGMPVNTMGTQPTGHTAGVADNASVHSYANVRKVTPNKQSSQSKGKMRG